MWSTTDAFDTALGESHVVAMSATILEAGLATADLTAEGVVEGGDVRVDVTSAARRTATVVVADETGDLTPDSTATLLAPLGNEFTLSRGVVLDGTPELVPLGVFQIERAVVEDTPDGGLRISLEGSDRSRRIQQARWTDTYSIAKGGETAAVVHALLDDRVPGLEYMFPTTDHTCARLVFTDDDDPWEQAQRLARSAGHDLYFDQAGRAVMTPTPDPATVQAACTFAEGATARLLGITRSLTNEHGYNGVVAVGESTSAAVAVRATVWDDDPSSPTYYLGPYGRRPRFYASPLLTTTAQCTSAARSILRRMIGVTESVEFTGLVNPALEVGDAVQITRARSKVDAVHILDSFTIPLSATGEMPATTRRQGSVPDDE